MHESNATFRGLRKHVVRQTRQEVSERVDRVEHHALGRPRMRALANEADRRKPGTPRLVADLAKLAAVNGVGELRAEGLDVELLDPHANLFVSREADLDGSV